MRKAGVITSLLFFNKSLTFKDLHNPVKCCSFVPIKTLTIMYIEQALEEAKKITATAKSVGVKPLEEGFVAIQYIHFPYDYEIPIAHLYKPTKQELVTEVAERWGLDISIINKT